MTSQNAKKDKQADKARRQFLGDSLRVACGVGLAMFGLGAYQRQASALPAVAISRR